ncbi:hypothetical protein TNCV_2041321 [Trichonephila clavipes]|nr:hypothetical protein TNCV_2041321 [Trichonephila clavipes]
MTMPYRQEKKHSLVRKGLRLFSPYVRERWAVGSLVVRASDSRPEGQGPMRDATKYPPSTHGFLEEVVEVVIGGVAIYHPFGEFRRAKSYCHLYGAQGQNDRRTSSPLPRWIS